MSKRADDTREEERLRTPPSERFQGPSHEFDLDAVVRELRAEDHPARNGHRQITLFQRGHLTHMVLAFDEGGRLAEHTTRGLVTIHVHAGSLDVQEGGREHRLSAGQLLVLDPGVPHDVTAREESVMLLTVHVERQAS